MTCQNNRQKENLQKRALILQSIRAFFISTGYLEVETPIRCPAIIPEAHIDPVTSQGHYLQASPELYMKILLSRGFDRIFQICKSFRKNERGPYHLPELTLLEWYANGCNYKDLMADCENLIAAVAGALGTRGQVCYQGKTIDLKPPWERLSVSQAFEKYASLTMEESIQKNCFDEVIGFEIEPHLGHEKPLFLYDYPAEYASLARLKPENHRFAQRFELYIRGIELANAFSELTDSKEQKKRFLTENRQRKALGKDPVPIPEKFLSSLDNLDTAAGIALGIDRLVMIFCNAEKIDDVVSFTPETL